MCDRVYRCVPGYIVCQSMWVYDTSMWVYDRVCGCTPGYMDLTEYVGV